jgi:hypothetical protein
MACEIFKSELKLLLNCERVEPFTARRTIWKNDRWGNSGSREPGDVVESDEIVNGYEYSKGQYAIIESGELDNLRVPSKHAIAVSLFIDQNELNPEKSRSPSS